MFRERGRAESFSIGASMFICIATAEREMTPAELLLEEIPLEKPTHLGVTLINGPYAGLRLAITPEVWEGGYMSVNGTPYIRKGRDNAGWEYQDSANLQIMRK